MARKTLLNESELRRFMRLASLRPLGAGKLQEMGYGHDEEDDLEEQEDLEMDVELGAPGGEEELGADAELGGEEDLGDEDLGLEDEEDLGDVGGDRSVSVDDFMAALEDALEDVLDEPVGVDMDDEEDLEAGDDMEVEDELAMGPEGGDDELEMGAMEDEEEIVAEVARRVAARLQKSQDQENLVNTISERIFQRLTSK